MATPVSSIAGGIVLSLVAGWGQCPAGSFYGQIPVHPLATGGGARGVMGLNFAGLLSFPPTALIRSVASITFLRPWPPWPRAASDGSQPLHHPVLAVLLAWTAQQAVPSDWNERCSLLRCGQVSAPACWLAARLLEQRFFFDCPLSR